MHLRTRRDAAKSVIAPVRAARGILQPRSKPAYAVGSLVVGEGDRFWSAQAMEVARLKAS